MKGKFSPKLQFGDWSNDGEIRLIHARLKKERRLHEPQDKMLIKEELMAEAGVLSEIVITSLMAGAKFSPKL